MSLPFLNDNVRQQEVLSLIIDAMWLYFRSVESEDQEMSKKLQAVNQSLFELSSYLEEVDY